MVNLMIAPPHPCSGTLKQSVVTTAVVLRRSTTFPPPSPLHLFGNLKVIPLRTCETVNFHEGKGAPGFLLAPRQECSRARHGRKRPKWHERVTFESGQRQTADVLILSEANGSCLLISMKYLHFPSSSFTTRNSMPAFSLHHVFKFKTCALSTLSAILNHLLGDAVNVSSAGNLVRGEEKTWQSKYPEKIISSEGKELTVKCQAKNNLPKLYGENSSNEGERLDCQVSSQ